jgi:hypothetical protein
MAIGQQAVDQLRQGHSVMHSKVLVQSYRCCAASCLSAANNICKISTLAAGAMAALSLFVI